jgi:hypothetical protein
MSDNVFDHKTFNLFGSWGKPEEDKTGDILESKVLVAQDSVEGGPEDMPEKASKDAPKQNGDFWGNIMNSMKGGGSESVDSLIQAAKDFSSSELSESKPEVNMDTFRSELIAIKEQLMKTFSDIDFDKIDAIAFAYHVEKEDSEKNPSWKRRQHRFLPGLEMETVYALHDALYLAELAYLDTVEDIQKGIESYKGDRYELIYCTVEGLPREPAHFICIKKDAKPKKGEAFPWSVSYLEVLLVVRGTKEMADMISDAMLESRDYRGGKAHDGVCRSGTYLVDKHLPLLEHVLAKSKRKRIKLTLVGHSLGAGAAAIACIEFNDVANIDATCIGFGCPALVNKEMSEKLKDKITTIVSDSDCVPRMSGATVANLLMDISEHDWTPLAMDDVKQLIDQIGVRVPFISAEWMDDKMKWVKDMLQNKTKPVQGLQRKELELYPPGKCIHLYRDGVGISAVEVPCTFFNQLDVTRTMVDDHLVPTGYNRVFHELMRSHTNDSKFVFRNDVMALRAEKVTEGDIKEK